MQVEADHQKELADWDLQFLAETGIDLRPPCTPAEIPEPDIRNLIINGAYSQLMAPGIQNMFHSQLGGQQYNQLPVVPGYEQYSQLMQQTMSREGYLSWYNSQIQAQMGPSLEQGLQGMLGRRKQ
jgi:hypothetical protein